MQHSLVNNDRAGAAGVPVGAMEPATCPGTATTAVGRVQYCRADALSPDDLSAWLQLAATAAEANVFAQPWMVLPALAAIDTSGSARVALVSDNIGQLIGVMPVAAKPLPGRIPLNGVADWNHPNSFLSPIVIAAGREREFWTALLPRLHDAVPGARCAHLSAIVDGSACHRALLTCAAELGAGVRVEQRSVRAMLMTNEEADSYWENAVRPKKRKELRRQWNRLGEMGAVSVECIDGSSASDAWMDEFLTLEASGWKGTHGSALASAPATEAFFRDAMQGAARHDAVTITVLRLDGRAIAMLITLNDGRAGFSFKTAFDERYARYSPGVLLQRESLKLLGRKQLDFIDSCAAEDHPMIDSLWRERRTILTLSWPLPGRSNQLAYGAVHAAQRLWHAIKPRAKKEPVA